MMRTLSLKISLLIMGLSGITAQIVLLRELFVSFLGNELTLGVILANWLILEAFGSFVIGKTVEKTGKRIEIYVLFQLIFSLSLPIAIYLARIFKNFLGATPGEGLGFAPIFYSSLLILLPVALFHGALFTYGSKLYSQWFKEEASSIGKVYVAETVGSIIGGFLVTFILIRYFHAFEIAFIVSLMNTLISIFLLWPNPRLPKTVFQKTLWVLSIFLSVLFAFGLTPPSSKSIHQTSLDSQWRNLNVIHNENSIYGNIVVTKMGEQFTFFTDGIPTITTPVPDVAAIEDFVHFPLLFHENPKSVLILSGGVGGMIREILKYPEVHIDYVELDPLLLKLVQKFSTPLTQSELLDPRVNVHYMDGRFYVKRTKARFDMIFIGLSAPQELQTNRLFSIEFFSIAKRKMSQDGILVLTLPGSLTYISPELRDLNQCILKTLKKVYRYLRIIPGDVTLYLASDSEELKKLTLQDLVKRFEERKIQTNLLNKRYIEYRLHERWLNWFLKSMEGREISANSDFKPLGVFLNLAYWNALFSPYLSNLFKWFEGLNIHLTLLLTATLTFLILILFIKRPYLSGYALPYSIFTSGFADMMLNLAIIFSFQALYGYLYYQMGLLITIFMMGVALGSYLITKQLDEIKNAPSLFLKTELLILVFSFLLPFILTLPAQHLEKVVIYILLYIIFLLMSFLCGVLVGLQFPLANKIFLKTYFKKGMLGKTAGLLYGADLFGGFFGGLFGGVLLLPLLGLKETCFLMATLKVSSGLLFFLFMKSYRITPL